MTIINIRVFLVYIMLESTPDVYGPCFITDLNCINKIIVQCQSKIYVTVTASLIYYKKFSKSLED